MNGVDMIVAQIDGTKVILKDYYSVSTDTPPVDSI
jgi:hypothetical protein